MTDEERETIQVFIQMLSGLRVDKFGLKPDNHLGYLNPLAKMCFQVENITAAADTPEHLLVHRVAKLTGDLITTVKLAGGETIVREWFMARAELLCLNLSSL
jgi:hypothetical protein